MINKKIAVASHISTLLPLAFLLTIDLKTISNYINSMNDWHFIAAFIAGVLLASMIIISFFGLVVTLKGNNVNH